MGYGQNIITNAVDRLETGIGSWILTNIQGTTTFQWTDSAEIAQASAPNVMADIVLGKDYFSEIDIAKIYTMTIDVYWPGGNPGLVGLILGIRGPVGVGPSTELKAPPYGEWKQATSNFAFDASFDNDQREIYFRFNSLEAAATAYVKNLSIRPYSAAKIQYLPIMGIG